MDGWMDGWIPWSIAHVFPPSEPLDVGRCLRDRVRVNMVCTNRPSILGHFGRVFHPCLAEASDIGVWNITLAETKMEVDNPLFVEKNSISGNSRRPLSTDCWREGRWSKERSINPQEIRPRFRDHLGIRKVRSQNRAVL